MKRYKVVRELGEGRYSPAELANEAKAQAYYEENSNDGRWYNLDTLDQSSEEGAYDGEWPMR